MTYVVTQNEFERVVRGAFAFLRDSGFDGPAVEAGGEELRAAFARADTHIRLHCDAGCADVMTVVERPLLGRRLLLETIHSLNVGDSRYPQGDGGSWPSHGAFEERLALEATLLRENLRAATEDDTLYEEAGPHA